LTENDFMNFLNRIENTETRQFKMIFHNTVNDNDTLFGGTAMQWMDEVAYITATRFTRMNMVTVCSDKIEFLKPIKYGSIAEIIGKVSKVGNAKIVINVEIFIEDMVSDARNKAVEASFTFAAIDKNNIPVRITIEDTSVMT
jgi:acyl-CoA hydrolase